MTTGSTRPRCSSDITQDIGPRLSRLRTAASERFDEHTRAGALRGRCAPAGCRSRTSGCRSPEPLAARPPIDVDVPRLEAPNAKRGAALVAKHGGVDAAMMAYQPDSPEFDDIQAYRYVSYRQAPARAGFLRSSRASATSPAAASCAPSASRLRAPARGSDVTTSGS